MTFFQNGTINSCTEENVVISYLFFIPYNPNECFVDGNGLYVWTGDLWHKLGKKTSSGMVISPTLFRDPEGTPALATNPNALTLNMPSGRDLRPWVTPETITFTFADGQVIQTNNNESTGGSAIAGNTIGAMFTPATPPSLATTITKAVSLPINRFAEPSTELLDGGFATGAFILDPAKLYTSRWRTYKLAYSGKCNFDGASPDFLLRLRQTNFGGSVIYKTKEGQTAGNTVTKETANNITIMFRDRDPVNPGKPAPGLKTDISFRSNTEFALTKIEKTVAIGNGSGLVPGLEAKLNQVVGKYLPNVIDAAGVDAVDFSTDFGTESTAYDFAKLTFSEQSVANTHWKDITVMLMNCVQQTYTGGGTPPPNGLAETPSIEDWSTMIATAQNVPNSSGVAWHKDQDDQVFLSGDFGPYAGRWMLHNLRTKNFDTTRDPETPGSEAATKAKFVAAYKATAGISGADPTVFPISEHTANNPSGDLNGNLFRYPAANVGVYNGQPRGGLLYSFKTAVLGYFYPTGVRELRNLAYGETNAAGLTHDQVQGPCPSGWHIPSDLEWTQLENELIVNSQRYAFESSIYKDASSLVSYNGSFLVAPDPTNLNKRGVGRPYKDPCVNVANFSLEWQRKSYEPGTSFPIQLGGFNSTFSGKVSGASPVNAATALVGHAGYYWTSSTNHIPNQNPGGTMVVTRAQEAYYPTIKAEYTGLQLFMSIRCVENGSNPQLKSNGVWNSTTQRWDRTLRTPGDYTDAYSRN